MIKLQIYNVIDKHWCYGESYGKRGTFPSNHLHKVDIPYFKDTEKLFVSIAPFNGEQDGDLSFAEGIIYKLLIINFCEFINCKVEVSPD